MAGEGKGKVADQPKMQENGGPERNAKGQFAPGESGNPEGRFGEPEGNPSGRKPGPDLNAILADELEQLIGDNIPWGEAARILGLSSEKKVARLLVRAALKHAMAGKSPALPLVWEQLHGKATQPVEVTEGPIQGYARQCRDQMDAMTDGGEAEAPEDDA